jgi:signal transduction histidine kinase
MGLRHRSIRFRVAILIAVPVLSLIGLYLFAASFTLGNAIAQAHARTLRDDLGQPVSNFQLQLDRERQLAILGVQKPMDNPVLDGFMLQQTATNKALRMLQTALRSPQVVHSESAEEKAAIASLVTDATQLTSIRSDVMADGASATSILNDYDSIIDAGFPVIDEALEEQTNVPLVTQAIDLVNLAKVGELASEEGDLLAGDIEAHRFTSADRLSFAQLASQRQALAASTVADLQPEYRSLVTASMQPGISLAMTSLENYTITTPWAGGTRTPPPEIAGQPTFGAYISAVLAGASSAGNKLQSLSQHQVDTVFLQLLVAGILGLIGILASIALALLLGRNLVGQLRGLRTSALRLAHEKLPQVIGLLRDGQQVDLAEFEQPVAPTRNEIEQVEQSFNVVQLAAVQSAVDEAKLRSGVSEVFRNLAGRSLSLLQRQLTLLDGMERHATEPGELENLFRIDHLTTRMRRHAEGLIILSGEAPARAWRQPVQLVDVLRAAVAEVEDYTRIRVLSRTTASVAGHAVADVIHLIAELAENATVFSPPNTPVHIQGDLVARGFSIEIEDRGLGISAARLAEINANLADPPQFDPAVSDRLGLFIAGQLAKRHDIKITLQPSVYGGTTATVLLPTAVVAKDDSYDRALPSGLRLEQIADRYPALAPAPVAPSVPERSVPAWSVPAWSVPERSVPERSVPAPSVPERSVPERSVPAPSLPAPSVPAASTAAPSVPAPSVPAPLRLRPSAPAAARQADAGRLVAADNGGYPVADLITGVPVRPQQGDQQAGEPVPDSAFPLSASRDSRLSVAGMPPQAGSSLPPDDQGTAQPGWLEVPPGSVVQPRQDKASLPAVVTSLGRPDDTRVSAADTAELGLPVRVRQASLAPQLRDSGAGTPVAANTAGPVIEPHPEAAAADSPEAIRDTVNALQRGWRLGRAEANGQNAGAPAASLDSESGSADNAR